LSYRSAEFALLIELLKEGICDSRRYGCDASGIGGRSCRRSSISGDRRCLGHLCVRDGKANRARTEVDSRFLALDFAPEAAAARRAVLAGDVIVEPMETTGVRGEEIEVPSAMVHHWRGAVLIPGITVAGWSHSCRTARRPRSRRTCWPRPSSSAGPTGCGYH